MDWTALCYFHNQHLALDNLLDDLCSQSVQPKRLVIVDDDSDKPIDAIKAPFDIVYMSYKANGDVEKAMDMGVSAVRTKWVMPTLPWVRHDRFAAERAMRRLREEKDPMAVDPSTMMRNTKATGWLLHGKGAVGRKNG